MFIRRRVLSIIIALALTLNLLPAYVLASPIQVPIHEPRTGLTLPGPTDVRYRLPTRADKC